MNYFSKIKKIFSPSVGMTFINYFFKFAFKFALLIIVPIFLSAVEKGFWYTFISVAALTTFADLGFTAIITQFSAHESVYAEYDPKQKDFKTKSIESISSLFKFSVKWTGVLTIICSIVIALVGIIVFSKEETTDINWLMPWIIYAVASSFNFFNQVVLAFFEGCNQIVTSQRIKLIDGLIINALGIVGLALGFGLFALAIPMLLSVLVSLLQIIIIYGKVILKMFKTPTTNDRMWAKSILKLLWKYAISWGCGYAIFQVYNPIVFAKYGAEAAGEVGYIITIVGAFVSIANIWSYVSVPRINMLTEKKEWSSLNKEFYRNLILIELTFLLELSVCFLCYLIPFTSSFLNKYVFSIPALVILSVGYVAQLLTSYIGVYLRSHKEEPLMIVSVITAVLSLSITIISVMFLDLHYVFIGFASSTIVMLPVVFAIKSKKEKKWHAELEINQHEQI